MANVVYPKYRQALLDNGVDMKDSTIKVVLIDTGAYTYDATHDFLDDVPAPARIGTPQTLANKTILNGVFDADDVTFPSVAAGSGTANAVEAILIYRDSGAAATSELIAYIDGEFLFDVAVAAASGATTLIPEDLPAQIASSATLTKVSGIGPTTITLSAAAVAGDRSLAVNAVSAAVAAGAVYKASSMNFPMLLNGSSIKIAWNAAGILSLE